MIIAAGCTGVDAPLQSRTHPIVSTYPIGDNQIDELGATFNGGVLDIGTGVSDHGFYYGEVTIDGGSIPTSDKISLGSMDKSGFFSATATVDLVKGKSYHVRAYAVSSTAGTIVLGQEYGFTAKGSAAPTVTDFTPKEGIAGDTVVITGTGFSAVVNNNVVWFGDAFAPITEATSHELTVVVPYSTQLGGSDVMVDVVGQKVTSANKFNLTPMTMTSFEPNMVAIGDTVWFHGTNLPLVPAMSGATIFQRTALTGKSNRTLIGCVIANDAAVTSSDLTVVVGSQLKHFDGPIKLKAPVITSFDPVQGMPGVAVHINGQNFNPDPTRNVVMFGSTQLEVLEASKNVLLVKIPNDAVVGTINKFKVTLLDVLSGTSANMFTVTEN
ncbi:MAG: IPT/TIG domain-containing protein [Bacteroidota bacterium]